MTRTADSAPSAPSAPFRIFGSELSPYSLKVRAYLRYKGIPHSWIVRNPQSAAEYQRFARLPLIPVVVTPEGQGLQDSTPILEALEPRFPEPAIHPHDPVAAFVSALIEEYGDEWGNKWMFHYRWTYEPDQISCAERIAREQVPDAAAEQVRSLSGAVRARMVPRLAFVGSSPQTGPLIERSFERVLEILEVHLTSRPYLFGARPAFADFGLAPQIYEASTDPTPRRLLEARAPRTLAWAERTLEPAAKGDFETWKALEPTLLPLLVEDVAARFLPWSTANARALEAQRDELEVDLPGGVFRQKPQKYHARSLAALRSRYAAVADRSALDSVLERSGCLRWLR
jgi:glutathione S-transferase